MSWYEEAADAIVALINAAIEERGDMPEPNEITAIIAKHDPNRWVPVEERMPPCEFRPLRDVDVRLCDGSRSVMEAEDVARYVSGDRFLTVSHWREIVLPEVKR